MTSYFIFAGETSGDLHGSALIQSLKRRDPSCHISGVGGARMRQESFHCFKETEQFQVMGFSDVFLALPRLIPLFRQVRQQILTTNPDCVILIDYPGFNLRLARSLRKHGFKGKLVQYICPTVWAHGKGRIDTLVNCYDLLLTIFPFEAPLFAGTSLTVEYVGNPLSEALSRHNQTDAWHEKIGLSSPENVIALFPGSRLGEISRHLPQQLEVAAKLKLQCPEVRFVISLAEPSLTAAIEAEITKSRLHLGQDLFIVPPKLNYDVMNKASAALAKSGTVTLELALHGIPTVVQYQLTSLNYLIAKYILQLKLPHYCIVNILYHYLDDGIHQHEVFPEYIGTSISTDQLTDALRKVYSDNQTRKDIQQKCSEIKQLLATESCSDIAVNAIERLL